MSNGNTYYNNYKDYDYGEKKEESTEMNDSNLFYDGSQFKELYTNTYRPPTSLLHNQMQTSANPTVFPTFVKDVAKPFTYYTVTNETYADVNVYNGNEINYINFNNDNDNDNDNMNPIQSVYDPGCIRYFCGLFGCFVCCLYNCKPF